MIRALVTTMLAVMLGGCAGAVEQAPAPVSASGPRPHTSEPKAEPATPRVRHPEWHPLVIGGPGFWCGKRPASEQPPDKHAVVAECFRTEETCEMLRARLEKSNKFWEACKTTDRAACFMMADLGVHAIGFRCFESVEQCAIERPSYIRNREDKGYRYTECEWTSRVELSERGRAIAYAIRHAAMR